jgi:tetratricopeptide (TPR) repeat protein
MRTVGSLFPSVLAGLFLAAATVRAEPPRQTAAELTPAQREKLKERDRLVAQVQEAQRAGKLDDAVAAARKMLALEQEVFGPAHEEVAGTWELLAGLYEAMGSYAEARQALQEVQKVSKRLYGARDWRALDVGLALRDLDVRSGMSAAERREAARLYQEAESLKQKGNGLYGQGRYVDAAAQFAQALALYRRVYPAERYPNGHVNLAISLDCLGFLLRTQGELSQAEPCCRDALAMYRRLYPAERYADGHPYLALSLYNLGMLLHERGKLNQAEPCYREALAMFRRLYPDERFPAGQPHLAHILTGLGSLLQNRGKLDQAEPCYREALAMYRRLYPAERFPGGHPHLAHSLNDLGVLLQARGELGQAEPFFRDALAMYRRLYPAERHPAGHTDLARSLSNLGSLLQARGELGQAEPLYREALAMVRRLYPAERYPAGHAQLADSLNNLGFLLQARGELVQAEPFYRDALAMNRKLYPAERYPAGHAHLAMSLNNLGSLLLARGELGQAEPFLRDALAMRRRLYPAEHYPAGHRDLADSLNNLGFLLDARGELGQAEPFYREALAMYRRLYPAERYPAGHPDLAYSLNNLGGLLRARGELGQAEPFFREALAMFRRLYPAERYPAGHPDLATSLNNLAVVLENLGERGQAEPFYREALAMRRRLYPAERYPAGHPDLAESLNNLGLMLWARGELDQAEPFFRDALAMQRKLYPAGHSSLAISLINRGALLQARGELGQAAPFYCDALITYQAQLRELAELYGETEALNFAARLPVTRDAYLSVTRSLPSSPRVYETVWQGKGLLMRIAARRHDDLLANRHPGTRRLTTQLGDVRAQLTRLLTQPSADVAEHRRLLQQLTERKEALERAIGQELKQQPPAAGPAPLPDDLRRVLPGHAVFIDFLYYLRIEHDPRKPGREGETRTPCYVAFVLSKERPALRVELGPAAPIERALKDWRREIELSGKGAEPSDADRRLTRLVWQPLLPHVPADAEIVYLCPDADLTRLPWAALPGRQLGRVLLEEHALALVPHPLYLLEQLQAKPRPAADDDLLLAYGAVRYDQQPGAAEEPAAEVIALNRDRGGTSHASWLYLKGTDQELAQVLAHAGRRKTLVRRGSAASLAQLMHDLPQARWAHLATHGFFDDQGTRSVLQLSPEDYERARWGGRVGVGLRNPLLLSGLVLAGADRKAKDRPETFDPDGGILTGEGLLALPLERLDLVVLSACETGLGDVAGGEGVFGLQRAFHVAGCRNVVASLWQVGDASTPALMTLFYHYLWDKELPPLEALRRSQLYLYYHPEEIPALAQERGPKRDVVAKVPDEPKPPTSEKPVGETERPKGRAAVKQWAGFLLSGAGR